MSMAITLFYNACSTCYLTTERWEREFKVMIKLAARAVLHHLGVGKQGREGAWMFYGFCISFNVHFFQGIQQVKISCGGSQAVSIIICSVFVGLLQVLDSDSSRRR